MMRLVVLLFLLMTFNCLSVKAQNKQFLYGFKEIPQSLLENPGGEVNYKKHIGIPFLSGIYINAATNNKLISNLFAKGVDINDRYQDIIHELSSDDFLIINERLDIINIGYKLKNGKDYINFGFYQELDLIAYHPKDLAVLYYQGNNDRSGSLSLNQNFNFDNVNYKGEVFGVFHIGISRKVNEKLNIGARVKLYSGAYNIQSINNRGTITTQQDNNNNFQTTLKDVDANFSRSGLTGISSSNFIGNAIKNGLSGGNLGLGLDLGFTYHFREDLTLLGSVLDIGFINYSKDINTYSISGNIEINGLDILNPPTDKPLDYWEDIRVDVDSQISIDTLHSSFVSFRSPKIYTSLFYKFERDYGRKGSCTSVPNLNHRAYLNEVGVQIHTAFRPVKPQMAASLFYTRRIAKFLKAKVTYTVDSYSFYNIGLGVSSQFGKFNFYAAADNLLGVADLYNSKKISVSLGMNLIFE